MSPLGDKLALGNVELCRVPLDRLAARLAVVTGLRPLDADIRQLVHRAELPGQNVVEQRFLVSANPDTDICVRHTRT